MFPQRGGPGANADDDNDEALTHEQIQEYKEAFNLVDKDSNGKISRKELGNVLKSQGWNVTEMEVQNMLRDLDEDGDNMLSFQEFISIIEKQHELNKEDKEEYMAVFKICDYDGSGHISPKELHEVLQMLGENFTLEEL